MKRFIKLIKCFRRTGYFTLPETRITPSNIKSMSDNEYFVFGSNLDGDHAGGAARFAKARFGAKQGLNYGHSGRSFAIPTLSYKFGTMSVDSVDVFVNSFLRDVGFNKTNRYLVTPIGCGIAGRTPEEIAPLFKDAMRTKNIALPQEFWDVLLT